MTGEPVPFPSSARWASLLEEAAVAEPGPPISFRLIRTAGERAVVRLAATTVADARRVWNRPGGPADAPRLRTVRTWGTLVGAKAWLSERRPVEVGQLL